MWSIPTPSSVMPHRRAFGEERINALAGIFGQHVRRHDLRGVAVGGGEIELGLAVERLLADLDGEGGFGGNLSRERFSRLTQRFSRHHPVDKSERACCCGIDQ